MWASVHPAMLEVPRDLQQSKEVPPRQHPVLGLGPAGGLPPDLTEHVWYFEFLRKSALIVSPHKTFFTIFF